MSKEYSKMLMSKGMSIVDEEEQIVEGIVTDDLIDIDGHIIDANGFKAATADYLTWGNIREQHGLPVGKVVDNPEWNKFAVKIVDDAAWKKVKSGIYKGFSIGIRVLDIELEDASKFAESSFAGIPSLAVQAIKESGVVIRITKMVLAEISIVDRPANPRALITSIKSMESDNNAPYVPVIGSVLKAQNAEGENQMSENTQVEQLDETVAEEVQKEVATTEDQQVVDYESRIASLEKSVTDLAAAIPALTDSFTSQFKMIQDTLDKALQGLAPAKEAEVVADKAVEVVEEIEEKAVEATVDVEKTVAELVAKAIADIQTAVTKSVDEAVKKIETVQVSTERVGGVNGGDVEEAEVQKSTTVKKATYKDAALRIASRFGATVAE